MKYKTSDARRRATVKYDREKVDRVLLRLPKGQKEVIQKHIETTADTSLNGFVSRAINETIERDNRNK